MLASLSSEAVQGNLNSPKPIFEGRPCPSPSPFTWPTICSVEKPYVTSTLSSEHMPFRYEAFLDGGLLYMFDWRLSGGRILLLPNLAIGGWWPLSWFCRTHHSYVEAMSDQVIWSTGGATGTARTDSIGSTGTCTGVVRAGIASEFVRQSIQADTPAMAR